MCACTVRLPQQDKMPPTQDQNAATDPDPNTTDDSCFVITLFRLLSLVKLDVFSLVMYMADFVFDIMLVQEYYALGDWHWFGITLGAVLVPSLVVNVFSLWLYQHQWGDVSARRRYTTYICFGVQFLPLMR